MRRSKVWWNVRFDPYFKECSINHLGLHGSTYLVNRDVLLEDHLQSSKIMKSVFAHINRTADERVDEVIKHEKILIKIRIEKKALDL